MPHIAYLSLGSNLGDRAANLGEATRRVGELGTVLAESSIYETEPVEVDALQPWYFNSALVLSTEKTAQELMEGVLAIEHAMGRRRERPKAPRLIDIDILLFDDQVVNTNGLTLPHPGLHQRRFVLQPLSEIAADVRHPVLKKTIRELRDSLPSHTGSARALK